MCPYQNHQNVQFLEKKKKMLIAITNQANFTFLVLNHISTLCILAALKWDVDFERCECCLDIIKELGVVSYMWA